MKVSLLVLIVMLSSCSDHNTDLKQEYELGKLEYIKGRLEGAKKKFTNVNSYEPNYKDVSLYLGKIEFYQGHFLKASQIFSSLLDDDTYGYQAFLLKIKSDFFYQKDRSKLLEEVGAALNKDSSNLELLLLSAKLHEELGKIPEAIQCYERIVQETDVIILSHKELHRIYQRLGFEEKVQFHQSRLAFFNEEKKRK